MQICLHLNTLSLLHHPWLRNFLSVRYVSLNLELSSTLNYFVFCFRNEKPFDRIIWLDWLDWLFQVLGQFIKKSN